MTRIEKLRVKLGNHAVDHGWTLSEVECLLADKGFALRNTRGSHHNFANADGSERITIPSHGGAVKAAYIRDLRKKFIR